MRFSEIVSVGDPEKVSEGRVGYFNALVRRRLFGVIESLKISLPGDPIEENLREGNVFSLAPGMHVGGTFNKADTEVIGVAAGAVMSKGVTITQDAVVDGVTFSTPAGSGPLVNIQSGNVVLRGCTFEKPGNDTSSHVTVGNGPKVILIGCVFRGSGTSSDPVVDHPAGAATDVQVAFCYNKTGNTLGDAADVTMTGNI